MMASVPLLGRPPIHTAALELRHFSAPDLVASSLWMLVKCRNDRAEEGHQLLG
jgi:hypothetical protein